MTSWYFWRNGLTVLVAATTAGLMAGALLPLPAALAASQPDRVTISMPGNADAGNVETKTLSASVTIDAPPSFVWQTITNYSRLKNILPGYEKSDVLKSAGSVKTVDVAMKVSLFLPTYHYQVSVRENRSGYRLEMQRISGDFDALNATYRLQPLNGGKQTMMLYNLSLDPGFNLPGTEAILKSSTEKTMTALRSHIESEHRQSVIGRR